MSAADYADFLLAEEIAGPEFDQHFGDDWRTHEELNQILCDAIQSAFARHGYEVGRNFDEQAREYIPWMAQQGAIAKEGDAYTGTYYKLLIGQKREVLRKYLATQPIAKRIRTLRSDALGRALKRLAEEGGWPEQVSSPTQPEDVGTIAVSVPASDRIVTLSHNQSEEIEAATDAVIDELQGANGIDGDADMRARFLGQLRASKELVRSQSIRAYLLYETAVGVLGALVERYKDHAIAEVAQRLLDLLIERVFKS